MTPDRSIDDVVKSRIPAGDAVTLERTISRLEAELERQPADAATRERLVAALLQLGPRLVELGELTRAVACHQRAVELATDSADAHARLGWSLAACGRHEEAVVAYRRVVELRPEFAEAQVNLGASLQAMNRLAEAESHYRRSIALKGDLAEAQANLGVVLAGLGRFDEALASYRAAQALRPDFVGAIENEAAALTWLGRYAAAAAAYRRIVRLRPADAEGHFKLGAILQRQGHIDESAACYERALAIAPDHAEAHTARAMLWLAAGDFARGWPEYEWRLKTVLYRPPPTQLWDGSPLAGKTILLRAEQGLGDTIQFVRYAAQLKQQGATVRFECPPPLLGVVSSCAGIDQITPRGEPLPAFDVYVPLMSLPAITATTLETIPAETPYLFADAELVHRWRTRLAECDGVKIGVFWWGKPLHGTRDDRSRSFRLGYIEPLARLPGVRLLSLQKGPGAEQIKEVAGQFNVVDFGDELDAASGPFMDTAAIMKCMDLIVCCDSAIAHLAGALGVPTWLALAQPAEWRWLRDRDDSTWYPSLRLFRQPRPGDWLSVFARMRTELERLLASAADRAGAGLPAAAVQVPISPGELLDKITILQIKSRRIADEPKRKNVAAALETLARVRLRSIPPSPPLDTLTAELLAVNEQLWEVEDRIRQHERSQDFGPAFIELARSIYRLNDRRAAIKRAIDDLLGSSLVDEKSYPL